MSGTAAARTFAAGPLYLRCLAWGLATGAATGGVLGVMTIWGVGEGRRNTVMPSPVDALSATAFGALLGAIVGALVSVVPSLVGGLLVAGLMGHLHPRPSSLDRVRSDLQTIFAAFAAVLTIALLLAIFAGGKGLSSVTSALPYILIGGATVALVLWRASTSIARAMLGARPAGRAGPAADAPRARAW